MANNFPPVNEIFDELDRFRDFCRYEGKVYNEASLYREGDPVYQDYKRYLAYHRNKNRRNNTSNGRNYRQR
jgi:hypothetical protein